MTRITTLLFLLCQFYLSGQPTENSTLEGDATSLEIQTYVERIMDRHGVPGASLAILKGDEVIYRKNFGYASLEHQVPITDRSIFRLYSLTKPVVSVAIFQLIEQGKLHLSDHISQYVPDLPVGWSSIQIKHLLSHSSGLPDMAPIFEFQDLSEEEAKDRVFNQELKAAPGTEYDYNQTNFWLLKEIIEKVSGQRMSDFILNGQFSSEVDTSFFSVDSRDIIMGRVTPYFPFQKATLMMDHSYLQGDYGEAMNGLNITMDAFIDWDISFRNDIYLKESTKKAMLELYPYTDSDELFAYGWDQRRLQDHVSYGFSGGLVTAYSIFPDKDLRIILLSNGLSDYYSVTGAVQYIAGIVDADLMDPTASGYEVLLNIVKDSGFEKFKHEYSDLKSNITYRDVQFEGVINTIGYRLLRTRQIDLAIQIFKLNNSDYPSSWNTYDSLAEALESKGHIEKAIINYTEALKRNTEDANNYNGQLRDKIKELMERQ